MQIIGYLKNLLFQYTLFIFLNQIIILEKFVLYKYLEI